MRQYRDQKVCCRPRSALLLPAEDFVRHCLPAISVPIAALVVDSHSLGQTLLDEADPSLIRAVCFPILTACFVG